MIKNTKLTNQEKWKISFKTALIVTGALFFPVFIFFTYFGNPFEAVILSLLTLIPLFIIILIGKRALFLNNLFINLLYLLISPILADSFWVYAAIKGKATYSSFLYEGIMTILLPFQFTILYTIFIIHKKLLIKKDLFKKILSFLGLFFGIILIISILSSFIDIAPKLDKWSDIFFIIFPLILGIIILFLHIIISNRGIKNDK
ncbi:hypothetical protein J4433_02165 [Candidatus Pacearchaeota archaeon]|nr:hypothetical protein [Candidatus Pacearchaeota archaeon]